MNEKNEFQNNLFLSSLRSLKLTRPLVLGPFGGVSSPQLVAAVSNAGGLGSYGCVGMSPQQIKEAVESIRSLSDKAFSLNLWLPHEGSESNPHSLISEKDYTQLTKQLAPFFDQLDTPLPAYPSNSTSTPSNLFESQLSVIYSLRPAVLSLTFGVPSAELIAEAHRHDIRVIATATTVVEAQLLAKAHVDGIVVQGMEAGGHRTSFHKQPEDSIIGLFSLLPQAVDAIREIDKNIFIIAAGGISDPRQTKAAFTLGADAIQVGTAFLACDEANINEVHRLALRDEDLRRSTVLTRGFSGRLARTIYLKGGIVDAFSYNHNNNNKNNDNERGNYVIQSIKENEENKPSEVDKNENEKNTDKLGNNVQETDNTNSKGPVSSLVSWQHLVGPYPVQVSLVSKLRPKALLSGRKELVSLWCGQSAPLMTKYTAAEVIQHLFSDAGI